jgi:serine/threonine-protein kinase RsbW
LSQTEKLSLVREFVSEAAGKFGFDEESINKISIAVDEACTNIIKHSYDFASNKNIDLAIIMNESKFEIVISHQGKSFDPESVKPPDMKEYLSHFRRGGLGMHLMRSLMDHVEYTMSAAKRNEVHLIKYLPEKINR